MANLSAMQTQPTTQIVETENDTIRDYDNLFRIFYNHPPNLDSVNIANAYVQCKSLLNLADMYDALEVIGPRVDHHLLRFQGRLWKQIAKYPPQLPQDRVPSPIENHLLGSSGARGRTMANGSEPYP